VHERTFRSDPTDESGSGRPYAPGLSVVIARLEFGGRRPPLEPEAAARTGGRRSNRRPPLEPEAAARTGGRRSNRRPPLEPEATARTRGHRSNPRPPLEPEATARTRGHRSNPRSSAKARVGTLMPVVCRCTSIDLKSGDPQAHERTFRSGSAVGSGSGWCSWAESSVVVGRLGNGGRRPNPQVSGSPSGRLVCSCPVPPRCSATRPGGCRPRR